MESGKHEHDVYINDGMEIKWQTGKGSDNAFEPLEITSDIRSLVNSCHCLRGIGFAIQEI